MAARMGRDMASAVALDTSPATVLAAMRGTVVDARLSYPGVLHVEIRDSRGHLWRLATQDAKWSPTDPVELIGRSVERAEIDRESGRLRCRLSGDTTLDIESAPARDENDPPSWELISPAGLVLEFGPGFRWRISLADARVSR